MAKKNGSVKSLNNSEILEKQRSQYPKSISEAFQGIRYINSQMKKDSEERKVIYAIYEFR